MSNKPQFSDNHQVFLIIALIFGAMLFSSLLFFGIRPSLGDFDLETFDGKDIKSGYLLGFVSQISLLFIGYFAFLRIMKLRTREIINFNKVTFKLGIIITVILLGGLLVSEFLSFLNVVIIEQFPRSGFIEAKDEHLAYYKIIFDGEQQGLFVLALLIYGLMPAIIEELIFRGLLLKKLIDVSEGRIHFSVIVSAMIFAAVHMQAWNLLPMVFMGVLLGYVYVYTKDIRYNMLMHFLFNGINLGMAFFFPEIAY